MSNLNPIISEAADLINAFLRARKGSVLRSTLTQSGQGGVAAFYIMCPCKALERIGAEVLNNDTGKSLAHRVLEKSLSIDHIRRDIAQGKLPSDAVVMAYDGRFA